ncbi:hypothetical protein [Sinomonas sp. G460-2]|uniref:hypothetical protein n=1 Tax=Sinomonas sp. G460-2 TaxID=3393464 RepID=UPI0039EF43D9
MTDEEPWYAQLRIQWKPERVRLLMIAESAPANGGDESSRRFFYAPRLGRADNLFRGVVHAMYGTSKLDLQRTGKHPWLERLCDDGFLLIDLAPYPVNNLSRAERRQIHLEAVPGCVARAAALDPTGIVVVKKDLYGVLARPLLEAGLPLLQDGPIAFPLGNTRAEFVAGFNLARSQLPARHAS